MKFKSFSSKILLLLIMEELFSEIERKLNDLALDDRVDDSDREIKDLFSILSRHLDFNLLLRFEM